MVSAMKVNRSRKSPQRDAGLPVIKPLPAKVINEIDYSYQNISGMNWQYTSCQVLLSSNLMD